jgi:transposase
MISPAKPEIKAARPRTYTTLWDTIRRWVVERTFAWLNRNRLLAKDFERTIESATAWLFLASIQMVTRRIVMA